MKNLSSPLIAILFLISLPLITKAVSPLSVVINEIAWMGSEISYNDEWIELYNNTNSSIDLSGWRLVAQDGTPEINLSGMVPGNGFYLLERTNDETIPNIPADQIYTGALGNQEENLGLYDNFGNLIDQVNCSSGWFAGDNSIKQTMEKINPQLSGSHPDNWGTSQNSGGTPKVKNSISEIIKASPQIKLKPELQPEEPQPEPQFITYSSNIFINEILPSPEGPDQSEEWIELKNLNSEEANLSGWKIKDTTGAVSTYTFPENTKISSKGYLVLSRPTTKITLNNEGDGLSLIQPDGNIIDTVTYEKAPRGESYNKTESGWVWSTTLTPGSVNIIPTPISETKEVKPSQEEIKKEIERKKELAAVGEPFQQTQGRQTFIFLIALAIAIFSGIIILILKRKIKMN